MREDTCRVLRGVVAVVAATCTVPAQERTLAEAVDPAWARSPAWSNGKAEVAVYEAQRVVDGEARLHDFALVTSAESYTREHWTRADWPHGSKPIVEAIQQLQVAEIPMVPMPAHVMGTVVADRSNVARCFKMTLSFQESAGSAFKEYQLWRDVPAMRYSSLRDGEGSGERTLPEHGANSHFEEELLLVVRALKFDDGMQVRFSLQPNQTTSRAEAFAPSPAILTVIRPGSPAATGIGRFEAEALWLVVVEAKDGRALDFLVEAAAPNRLLAWSHGDGRRCSIKTVERR